MWWTALDHESRVLLRLYNDSRLVAGVGGAIARVAEHVALEARAGADFAAAVEAACRSALDAFPAGNATLDVIIAGLADRIEVTLARVGQPTKRIGAPEPMAFGPAVDRVEYDEQGAVRVTLVKYVRASHSWKRDLS